MLNRRTFVHSLGVGAAGSLALVRSGLRVDAAAGQERTALQERAARLPTPPGAIRIGSNENPYGPAPAALEAALLATAEGNRYGGTASSTLVDALAKKHGVPAERLMLSGGSGDVLRAAVRAFTSTSRPLVAGSPSYEQPVRQAKQAGVTVHEVPLTPELNLDLPGMLARSQDAGLVYICNPNNPTSTIVPVAEVIELIDNVARRSPTTSVLVDEAYFEYAEDPLSGTVIPLLEKYPRLIVARTFSKIHGMAGMRVGYAAALEPALTALREHHSASAMSVMSLSAAAASLRDGPAIEKNQALNRQVRARTTAAFETAGYRVARSQANFVMVDIRRDVTGFIEACRLKGVVIGRPFPPLTTWARITIGTESEMDRAMAVFTEVLATAPTSTAGMPLHPSLSGYWTC